MFGRSPSIYQLFTSHCHPTDGSGMVTSRDNYTKRGFHAGRETCLVQVYGSTTPKSRSKPDRQDGLWQFVTRKGEGFQNMGSWVTRFLFKSGLCHSPVL